MHVLLDRVRQFVRDHALIGAGTRVVAAVSGGSDSVALAHLLRELDAPASCSSPGSPISTISFAPRPTPTSDSARELAASLGVPLLRGSRRRRARARGASGARSRTRRAPRATRSSSARARHCGADCRRARPHARRSGRNRSCCGCCAAPGRAASAACIRGTGAVVRPLLDCRRDELRACLRARGSCAFVDDESNADVSIPRNRVRAELLPLLEAAVQPGDRRRARRRGRAGARGLAVDGRPWPTEIAARVRRPAWDSERVRRHRRSRRWRRCRWRCAALVLWRAMTEPAARRPVAFGHVAAALASDRISSATAVSICPGQRVERIGARLVLTGRPADAIGRRVAGGSIEPFPLSAVYPRRGRAAARPAVVVSAETSPAPPGRRRVQSRAACRTSHDRRSFAATSSRAVWPSEIAGRATVSGPSGSTAGRSCRTSSWTGRSRGDRRDIGAARGRRNATGLCGWRATESTRRFG